MPRTPNAPAAKVVRDPGQTRARILSAAKAEFASHGLGGARVDRIAAEAGANKRMLYHYFGNKDELFTAVLESAYADIRSSERLLRLEETEPTEAIRRLIAPKAECRVTWPRDMARQIVRDGLGIVAQPQGQ